MVVFVQGSFRISEMLQQFLLDLKLGMANSLSDSIAWRAVAAFEFFKSCMVRVCSIREGLSPQQEYCDFGMLLTCMSKDGDEDEGMDTIASSQKKDRTV